MVVCYRCRVSGRVQGVWYRASTRRRAAELGITGYARNLPDGQVEVLVCGDPSPVEVMRNWLWEGPPAANVTGVSCERVSLAAPDDFRQY
jgi:acylphosphatase